MSMATFYHLLGLDRGQRPTLLHYVYCFGHGEVRQLRQQVLSGERCSEVVRVNAHQANYAGASKPDQRCERLPHLPKRLFIIWVILLREVFVSSGLCYKLKAVKILLQPVRADVVRNSRAVIDNHDLCNFHSLQFSAGDLSWLA